MFSDATDFEEFIQSCLNNTNSIPQEDIRAKVEDYMKKDGGTDGLVEVLRIKLTCAVCLEIPTDGCIIKCKHVFCFSCIQMWYLTNHYCPMCRSESKELPRLLLDIDIVVDLIMSTHDLNYWLNRVEEDLAQEARYYTKFYTDGMLVLMKNLKKWEKKCQHRNIVYDAGGVINIREEILGLIKDYNQFFGRLPVTKENIDGVIALANNLIERYSEMLSVIKTARHRNI